MVRCGATSVAHFVGQPGRHSVASYGSLDLHSYKIIAVPPLLPSKHGELPPHPTTRTPPVVGFVTMTSPSTPAFDAASAIS